MHLPSTMKKTMFVLPNPMWGKGAKWDAFELSMVGEFDGGCDRIDSAEQLDDPELKALFWSIYGHTPGEGVDAFADAGSIEQALRVLVGLGVITDEDADQIKQEAHPMREGVPFRGPSKEALLLTEARPLLVKLFNKLDMHSEQGERVHRLIDRIDKNGQ